VEACSRPKEALETNVHSGIPGFFHNFSPKPIGLFKRGFHGHRVLNQKIMAAPNKVSLSLVE